MGIEPTFPLYESGVLPLNYLGGENSPLSLEPLTGIEPVTSSFTYTLISPTGLIKGLDCILRIPFGLASLVSRSGDDGRHGLTHKSGL